MPPRYETLEDQVARAYLQFRAFDDNMNKHIWLRAVQDTNETLYFRLLQDHLEEMLPIIYTPTVGDACEHFSDIYRKARGLFIGYGDRHHLDDLLRCVTKRKVKTIVITDGERVLGLGDQGIGGMGIPVGKLSLYTACGGISPAYMLPIMIDVGTDNEELLEDPVYLGERHKRIRGPEYDAFMEQVLTALNRRWPGVLIQFEDFAQPNAMPLLERYRAFYDAERGVRVDSAIPEVREVAATAMTRVGGFAVDARDARRVTVVAVLDNLLKGAASQAMQNLNLALGLDEWTGMEHG